MEHHHDTGHDVARCHDFQTGWQVCIKIRIFKRAETLGFTTLFSNLFERCTLTDNSRQTAYFAVGVFDRMTDDEALRLEVAEILWNAMDQLGPAAGENLSTCHDDDPTEHGDAAHLQECDEGISM
jgi:hypothetical protein